MFLDVYNVAIRLVPFVTHILKGSWSEWLKEFKSVSAYPARPAYTCQAQYQTEESQRLVWAVAYRCH